MASVSSSGFYPLKAQSYKPINYYNLGICCVLEVPGAIPPCPSCTVTPCCCFWKGEASKHAGHTVASAAKTFIMVLSGIKNAKYLSLQHAGLGSYFTLTVLFLRPHLKQ